MSFQNRKTKNANLKISIYFHFRWKKLIWGRFSSFELKKQMLIRLRFRPIKAPRESTKFKTDLSKLLEMNDLSNGRSWTEERVQHSKYFPNWNWLTFWTVQIELSRSVTLKLTNENPKLSDQLRSVRFTVCVLWINIIELNQWNI